MSDADIDRLLAVVGPFLLPIKKLLLGQSLDKVVSRDALANPSSLDWYVEFARKRMAGNA